MKLNLFKAFAKETKKSDRPPDWVKEKQRQAQALADEHAFERKEGEPLPPWIEYPKILLGSIGWRMGAGEDYLHEVFWPFWRSLTDREQDKYWEKFDLGSSWEDRSKWMRSLEITTQQAKR